ncbi:hypothetical protein QUF84_00450 [Fictibacillus enclensis]|uniref:hypothetical protein n=1 Tax=Fictibacillus enclensis TaxID=1017270 RepID=UPI0025A2DFB6|nr:hypothetical protein [Fictibacillus enclensis]MDM5335766.1 hypothetical protein [Fictibacillus enclensis]
MSFINPSFKSKSNQTTNTPFKENVRKPEKAPRKKRSDAKFDIKIYVSEDEKRAARLLANQARLSITPYCSELVKKALCRNEIYPETEHQTSGKPIEIKLEPAFNEILMDYCIEWDCSKRKAVQRIFKYALKRERGLTL